MKAVYNNGVEMLELHVLAENKDGTLELGTKPDKETLKVGKCPVCRNSALGYPAKGHARIVLSDDAPAEALGSPSNDQDPGEPADPAAALIADRKKGKGK